MSRFKQIKNPENNPELDLLYKEAVQHGFVGSEEDVPNNFITSLAERPDLLRATWGLVKGVALQGELPPTVKQMIGMTIAMQNDCRYCKVAYSHALESLGVPPEVIQSCASDPDLAEVPPPQRSILQFALKATRDPKSVTDEDFQVLRDLGMSDGEIMEAIMMAASANFIDLWADVSRIQVDGEEETQ